MAELKKAVYKCPCCDYCTHFPQALDAHQRFRKHFAPYIVGSYGPEFIVPADTPINVLINGESVDEKAIKDAIEEAVEKSVEEPVVKAEDKKRKPRSKAVKGVENA